MNLADRVKDPVRQCWTATVLCLALSSGPGLAQDDFFGTIDVEIRAENSRGDEAYSLFGWITQKLSHGLEDPGPLFSRREGELNKIETSLFAQLDATVAQGINFRFSGKLYHDEIYRLNDDTDYAAAEVNKFRNRFEVKDLYLERQYDNGLYVKAGNQILAWGLAEYVRVTDLINTEDQYTFGQQDLEDIRLQVPAALLSYSSGDWVFDAVVTAHAGRDDVAPAGDEFDQFVSLRNTGMTLLRDDPKHDTEGFVRASTHFADGDFQLVAGEFNDNALSVDKITALGSGDPLLTFSQNRMRAVGLAANWVDGAWLVFGELGLHLDKAVRPDSESFLSLASGWDEKDQLLSVLGVEYNGFRNLLLSFEVDNTHTRDHDSFMQAAADQLGVGSRLYWTALNERLQVLAVWNDLGGSVGRVSRLSIDYNWSDQIELGLLWVDYNSDAESVFYEFRNNDVLQLQLRYSFQL